MATKTTFPRHGKLRKTGQTCIVVGENRIAGIPTYQVKFKPRGTLTDWARESVILMGAYEEGR